MDDLVTWVGRIARVLPEFIGLWEASKDPNPKSHLDASLALVRKMKNEQAREEIGG